MRNAVHTRDVRAVNRRWLSAGGVIAFKRGTGEMLYTHPLLERPVRTNGRRKDAPAVLISRINQILRTTASNDPN